MSEHPILFYDGVCGLCDRLVQFMLRHDRGGRFRFAALQSDVAAERLARFGADPRDLDTVYLITVDGRLLRKARAVLYALGQLGLPWSLARAFALLPTPVLDWFYDRVAKNRYRWFGRYEQCRLPSPAERARFLDGGATPSRSSPPTA